MQPLLFIKKFALSFLVLGAVAAVSSAFWTSDIAYSKEGLATMRFGFPLNFLIVDQSKYDPPYPYEMKYCGPWECPARPLLWIPLGGNVLIYAITLAVMSFSFFSFFPSLWPLARFISPAYVVAAIGSLALVTILILMWLLPLIAGAPIQVVNLTHDVVKERAAPTTPSPLYELKKRID